MKTTLLLFTQLLFISYSFAEVRAVYKDDRVVISWTNPTNIKIDYFVIERSKNGKKFKELIKVEGFNSNSGLTEYYEIDNNPFNKKAYYRIRQVGINGNIYYSEMVIATNIKYVKPLYGLFSNSKDNYKLKKYTGNNILVVLIDTKGKQYIAKVNMVVENRHLVVTQSNVVLPTGDYLISATSDDVIYGERLIVKGINSRPSFYSQNR